MGKSDTEKQFSEILDLIETLAGALEHANGVMESYQMDIRNPPDFVAYDLVSAGFCQGTIYLNAPQRIRAALDKYREFGGP